MLNDIRLYNYDDNEPLISRMSQAKEYFDNKFANIKCEVDLGDTETKITQQITQQINDSTSEIIEAIEDSKPCLCHIATKEDVCRAKCAIMNKMEDDKNTIIKEIDEKFVDLNELIK